MLKSAELPYFQVFTISIPPPHHILRNFNLGFRNLNTGKIRSHSKKGWMHVVAGFCGDEVAVPGAGRIFWGVFFSKKPAYHCVCNFIICPHISLPAAKALCFSTLTASYISFPAAKALCFSTFTARIWFKSLFVPTSARYGGFSRFVFFLTRLGDLC
jgi:hypothetical protein